MPAICRPSNFASALSVVAALCTAAWAQHQPPSLDRAIDAWVTARAWVDAMAVPDAPVAPPAPRAPPAPPAPTDRAPTEDGAAPETSPADAPSDAAPTPIDPDAFGAVAVVLRLHGRVVGTAVDFGPPEDQLRRAVGRALAEAHASAVMDQLPSDAPADPGRPLALELEIASAPSPMPGRSIGRIIAKVEPALDAIALRRGERWAWMMPSITQASNTAYDPARSCVSLLTQLAIDVRDLPTEELPDSAAFYRAPTRRLAQRRADESPFEVVRGREIIPLAALGPSGRIEFATALARHLEAHVVQPASSAPAEMAALGKLGIKGDYRPHLDINRALSAPPQDQALAAFALAAFANMTDAPAEARRSAATSASALLVALAEVAEIEEDPLTSPTAVAFALLAERELAKGSSGAPPPAPEFAKRLRDTLRTRLSIDAAPDHTRAIELAAAAALLAGNEPVVSDDRLLKLLDEGWTPASGQTLIGTFPWLLLAERSRGSFSDDARLRIMREHTNVVRAALFLSQLGGGGPDESAPDAAGGFALAGPGGTNATSQTARPTLALALLLGSPVLTDASERADAMRSQLMALRFLRQLTVDDRSSYAFRDREKSVGGVCEALWDSTQPVAATAMTLLAVAESEPALRSAAGRSATSPPSPPIERNRDGRASGESP